MGAPLTVEQMILNHNIGVNISDATTFKGHTIDQFSMVGHTHKASDITSGVFSQTLLPLGSTAAKGIVQLSSNVNSNDDSTAANSAAVYALKQAIDGKANLQHTHDPKDINAGSFVNRLSAKSELASGLGIIRNIFVSDQPPSDTVGNDGDVYHQYQP